MTGETITYQYDSLNRLASAAGSGWGDTYGFDGFGNLLSKTPTAGPAPTLSQAVNSANNQIVGQTYDANGNQTSSPDGFSQFGYDAENRLIENYATNQYAYDSQNKRVWKGTLASGTLTGQSASQSWNRYAYTRGDPVNRADPHGADDCDADFCADVWSWGNPFDGFWDSMNGPSYGYACAFGFISGCNFGETGGEGGGYAAQSTGTSTTIRVSHLSTTSSRALDVQNILRSLEQAIVGDPKCDNWLTANSGMTIVQAIDYMLGGNPGNLMMVGVGSFSDSGTNAMSSTTGTNMAPGSMMITINTNGAFFNASASVGYGVPSWVQGGCAAAEGLILLHELAHLFEAPNFIENDGPTNGKANVAAQTTNNQLVMQNCGSIINSLGGH